MLLRENVAANDVAVCESSVNADAACELKCAVAVTLNCVTLRAYIVYILQDYPS